MKVAYHLLSRPTERAGAASSRQSVEPAQFLFLNRTDSMLSPWEVVAIGIPSLGAFVVAKLTGTDPEKVKEWYTHLKKSHLSPPGWIFGPVWTILYCSMGYASFLVWRDGGGFEGAKLPLSLYGAQLLMNWSWPVLFFRLESITKGLIDLSILTPTVAATAYQFFKVNPVAGGMMVPYVTWLSFATYLNFTLYRLNPSDRAKQN